MTEAVADNLDSYKDLYLEANSLRKSGDHEAALSTYEDALDFSNTVSAKDISLHTHSYRNASCRDMRLNCLIRLQSPPEKVLNELANYGKTLQWMLINDKALNIPLSFAEQLNFTPRTVNDVAELKDKIEQFYTQFIEPSEDDEVKAWAWIFLHFLTRWSFVSRNYYFRCTSQIDVGMECQNLSRIAGSLALKARESLPESYIENNKYDEESREDHTIKKLEDLLPLIKYYPEIQDAQAALIVHGNFSEAVKKYGKISEALKALIDSDWDREYIYQEQAKEIFAKACLNRQGFKTAQPEFHELYESCLDGFKKVAQHVKIYEARAALRYDFVEEAENAYNDALSINGLNKGSDTHVFAEWLKLIRAKIDFIRINDDQKGDIQNSVKSKVLKLLEDENLDRDIRDEINKKVSDLLDNENNEDFNESEWDIQYLRLLAARFNSEILPNGRIKKPEVSYLLIEAETYLLLGRIELEKAKISKKMENFHDSRTYFQAAYSMLSEIGYKDEYLLKQIEDSYKESINVDYEFSGVAEEVREKYLSKLKMEDVILQHLLKEWVRALSDITEGSSCTSNEPCEEFLAESLMRAASRFAPYITDLEITTKEVENEEKEVITSFPIDTGSGHMIVIKSPYELTKLDIKLFQHIAEGLGYFLRIHKLHMTNEGELSEQAQEEIVDLAVNFFENSMSIHESTINHERRAEMMMEKIAPHLAKTVLFHDAAKIDINPDILGKITRLNPAEMAQVRKHPIGTALKLRGTIGFKHFLKDIIKVTAHHTQYANKWTTYPFKLFGDEIRDIPEHFLDEMSKVCDDFTEEEKKQIRELELTDKDIYDMRILLILDVVEALTSNREYRERPLTKKEILGYIARWAGINFDPVVACFMMDFINEGNWDEFLIIEDRKTGDKIEKPGFYPRWLVKNYLESHADILKEKFDIDVSALYGDFKDVPEDLLLSDNAIRSSIFDLFIKKTKGDKHKAKRIYWMDVILCMDMFEQWAAEKNVEIEYPDTSELERLYEMTS